MEAVGPDRIKRQYAQPDLWASIEAAIRADSESRGELKVDDLAPLEEFHIGGRHASIELADMAGFSQGDRILDIGAGIGGPARLLASQFGCRVTALDLTEEYCEAARKLTEMVGLADRVTVRQGSALDLPFADAEFDGAWTQHASMNIENKRRFYDEIRRVLPTGGIFAMHDVHAGPVQPIRFPVPWADTPGESFLATPEETRELVSSAGFELIDWQDRTTEAIEFFRAWSSASRLPARLGVHVYVPNLGEKSQNQVENFASDRLRVTQAVYRVV